MLILLSLSTFALWTLSFSFGKMALQTSSPLFLTAFRMGLAGLLILGYLFYKRREDLKLPKEHYFPLFLFALFSVYLTNIFEFWGLKHVSPAKTCFLYSLTPFFTIILSYIHFREKITWLKVWGLAIALLSLFPVLLTQTGSEEIFRLSSFLSLPELSVMAAAFCSTYGWIILRILVKNKTIHPLVVNGVGMTMGAILALFHSAFFDTWNPIPVENGMFGPFLQSILLITLFSNLICYNLYSFLLKRLTATFLSFAGLLSPIFTSISSFFILGEAISWQIILCTFCMLFALFLVYYSEIKQGYILKKTSTLQET